MANKLSGPETRRLLYEMSVKNIEFCKQQQWRVANYALLVFAALIYLPELMKFKGTVLEMHYEGIAAFVIGLTSAIAIAVQYQLQSAQDDERLRIERIARQLPEILRLQQIRETRNGCSPRHWHISAALCFAIFFGAVVTLAFLKPA